MDETVQNALICRSCQTPNEASARSCTRCGRPLGEAPSTLLVSVDLRAGTLFHGRYEILGPLGRGGMGMVYRARDRTLDEVVAIKVLRPDFAQDPKMAERFKTEIKLARKVRHKNVCTIHDYGEERGLLYISMELIGGVDLKQILREKGGFSASEGYDLSIQVAEGLQAVHDAGIVHRDLKTPNIMRDEAGVARLMDFGVAKRLGEGTATATGHIVGTPEYMSPEQAQGHKVDFRSDIYALGIVVYEIFTGRVPFRGETPISTILKHLNEPPPLDGPQAEGIPHDAKAVLRKCLAKEPAQRYHNSREVADALRLARSPSRRAQPVPTAVLEAPTVRRSARRSGLLQPWLLVLPVVAVVAGVVVLRNRTGAPPEGAGASSTAAASPMAAGAPFVPAAAPSAAPTPTAPPVLASPAPTVTPDSPAPTAFSSPSRNWIVTPPPRPSAASRLSPSPANPRLPMAVVPSPVVVAPNPVATATPRPEPVEPGQLQVAVVPWGEVTVDGRVIGTTPLDRISLSPGSHVVRVRHPIYEIFEARVTIRSGVTDKVFVNFPVQGTRKQ